MFWKPDLRIMGIRYVLDGRRVSISFRGGIFGGIRDVRVAEQDADEDGHSIGCKDIKMEYATPSLWQQIKEVAKMNWYLLRH